MKKGETLQSGSEHVTSFGGSERALRKKLRKIFLSVFHDDVEQFKLLRWQRPDSKVRSK